ncbi:MAG: hypothetical protein Q4B63_05535 [Clostridium perfringens]|nr:hypothetical protein [Clostridium perfringens]
MKVRSRRYRFSEEAPSYWPSFVDIMTTVALVFFFIMIIAIGVSSIFVDNIAAKREGLYDKIEVKLKENNVDESIINFNREKGKIEISTETFFDSGVSTLKEDGIEMANLLSEIFYELLQEETIANEIQYIEIVGHTDFAGSTISGRTLSTNRAVAFLNEIVKENSILENKYGKKFKASGMSEFENYDTKEDRDRGLEEYDVEATKSDRKIEVRMVFNNTDLEEALIERANNKSNE